MFQNLELLKIIQPKTNSLALLILNFRGILFSLCDRALCQSLHIKVWTVRDGNRNLIGVMMRYNSSFISSLSFSLFHNCRRDNADTFYCNIFYIFFLVEIDVDNLGGKNTIVFWDREAGRISSSLMLQIPVWSVPLSSPFSFIYIFILFYNTVLSLGFGGQLAYKFVSINLPLFFFPLLASNNFLKRMLLE